MKKQDFLPGRLLKLINTSDPARWGMGTNKKEYLKVLEVVSERLLRPGYCFSKFKTYLHGKSTVFVPGKLIDDIAIRKVNDNIKRTFHVRHQDRAEVIRQLSVLLAEPYPISIIRLDVKSFYESIKRGGFTRIYF